MVTPETVVLSAVHTGGSHVELLDLLAHVGLAGNPSDALLAAAEEHRWPILALLAASYGCPSLNCMAAWLCATLPYVTPSSGEHQVLSSSMGRKEQMCLLPTNHTA